MNIGQVLLDLAAEPAQLQAIPIGVGETEEVLRELFTQNTGSHPLDSSGLYGSVGARNQRNPPWNRPFIQFLDDAAECVMVNAFLLLMGHWNLDEAVDRNDEARRLEEEIYEALGRSPRILEIEEWARGKGMEATAWNTSNADSFLDHVLEYASIWPEGRDGPGFIALSVHLGCDVRGGYSDPRVFYLGEEDQWPDLQVRTVNFWCCECEHDYNTYDFRDGKEQPIIKAGGAFCPRCGGELVVAPL
jgi:hypothetical protein